jgi:hypothetical protein
MGEQTDTTSEAKKISFWPFVVWPAMVLVLYFLSLGPVSKLPHHGPANVQSRGEKIIWVMYGPWWWAYFHTPLHKPLGLYMHVWGDLFDKSGELKT